MFLFSFWMCYSSTYSSVSVAKNFPIVIWFVQIFTVWPIILRSPWKKSILQSKSILSIQFIFIKEVFLSLYFFTSLDSLFISVRRELWCSMSSSLVWVQDTLWVLWPRLHKTKRLKFRTMKKWCGDRTKYTSHHFSFLLLFLSQQVTKTKKTWSSTDPFILICCSQQRIAMVYNNIAYCYFLKEYVIVLTECEFFYSFCLSLTVVMFESFQSHSTKETKFESKSNIFREKRRERKNE